MILSYALQGRMWSGSLSLVWSLQLSVPQPLSSSSSAFSGQNAPFPTPSCWALLCLLGCTAFFHDWLLPVSGVSDECHRPPPCPHFPHTYDHHWSIADRSLLIIRLAQTCFVHGYFPAVSVTLMWSLPWGGTQIFLGTLAIEEGGNSIWAYLPYLKAFLIPLQKCRLFGTPSP